MLHDFEESYLAQVEDDNYDPAIQAKPADPKFSAMQAQINVLQAEVQKLEQDRSASSTRGNSSSDRGGTAGNGSSSNGNGCYTCGITSHQQRNCPTYKSKQAQEKSGLSVEDWKKLNELIKEKTPLLPPRASIKDDDVFTIELNGKDEASYCRHCNRYTKGATKHSTKEHRGRQRFPYDPNAATTAPAPTPAPAPAGAAACVAQVSPQATRSVGFDLSNIPTVDSGSLFRACPETMYDFGSMTSRVDEDTEVEISAAGSNNGGFLSFIGDDYFPWLKD